MSQISLPYTFTANTLIQSAQVNSNFTTITGVVNGQLDSTNVNASVGIGANYIVSSGNGATGSFQGGAYTFTAGAVGSVPLTVTGITNQTADLFDVTLTSGGTKALYVDSVGITRPATLIAGTGGLSPSGRTGFICSSTGASSGSIALGGSSGAVTISTTNGTTLSIGSAALASGDVSATGAVMATGTVVSGSATAPFYAGNAGDGQFSRSTTTGRIALGGSSSYGTLDYGVTNAGQFSMNKALAISGALTGATSGSFSGTVTYTGSGGGGFVANGPNSGTGGGSYFSAQNAGATSIAIGNYSAIFGGAYNGQATIYASGPIALNQALQPGSSTYGPTSASVNGPLSVSGQTTTITSGAGAPASTAPAGSIYMRTDGAAGSRIYVNQNGSTTWTAIAGV